MKTSVFVYPWDLADEGFVSACGRISREIGVEGISVAVTYHTAKLLLPHNPKRRVYFPEPGALYFSPREDAFARNAIQPRVSDMAGTVHDAAAAAAYARSAGLRVTAWMVCLHNTWLGQRYPQYSVRNAFGDSYPFSLCPSRPEVREYIRTVLEEMLAVVQPDAVEFEAPGFLPFTHGFHHEIQNVALSADAETLLSLCFCDACRRQAPEELPGTVSAALERFFSCDGDFAVDMHDIRGLDEYIEARCQTVAALLGQLAQITRERGAEAVLVSLPDVRSAATGLDLRLVADTLEAVEIACYTPGADTVARDAETVRSVLPSTVRLQAALRPGHPDCREARDLLEKVLALRRVGVEGFSFYNYGLMRACEFSWVSQAVGAVKEAGA